MPSIGAPELLIVLAIVVVLFGATRIGDIGKGIGRGIKEFRNEIKDTEAKDKPAETATVSSAASTTPKPSDEPTSTQTH